jgi:predicted esterase
MANVEWKLASVLAGLLALHCGPTPPTGSGGTGGSGGSGGSVGTCPTFRTGANTITLDGKSMTFQMNVGQRVAGTGGPIIFYWHGTGMPASEVQTGFGDAQIAEVVRLGGLVASADAGSGVASTIEYGVWFRGDFAYVDQVVACAIQQLNIDTRHIHTLGYSAGGLAATAMAHDRNNYVGSFASYSGGNLYPNAPQDSNYLPPAMMMHGPQGKDTFIIDFYDMSHGLEDEYKQHGFFALDCEDTDPHLSFGMRLGQAPFTWQFFQAHPYKINPYPWQGGTPEGFDPYCKVVAP